MNMETPRRGIRIPRIVPILFGVVAVLVLLAWLCTYIPYAREQARRSSCLGNLKGLGLAIMQYSKDFGDKYPWRVGLESREKAWLDLGLVFPGYNTAFRDFFCPSSREAGSRSAEKMRKRADEAFRRKHHEWGISPYRGEPLESSNTYEVISYSYCFNAAGGTLGGKRYSYLPWTENARSTVRLLADKKAGVALTDKSNHKRDGRNVLYNDGHVKWKAGEAALNPIAAGWDETEEPDMGDPRAWWSDPPYYGE